MNVQIISHKGMDIFFTDLSNKTIEESQEIISEANKKIKMFPSKSVRSMINVQGMRYNTEFLNEMKNAGKDNAPYVIATAVYGLSAITKMIAKGVAQFTDRKTGFFDTQLEAMDWLAAQQE